MHRVIILVLLGLISYPLFADLTSQQLQYLVDHEDQPKALEDGPYDKSEIIDFLSSLDTARLEVADGSYRAEVAKLLGNFGDLETIRAAYDHYVNGKNNHERLKGYTRMKFSHPALLSVVGDDVYRSPTRAYVYHERFDFLEVPFSNAAYIIIVIRDSGFFSDNVVKWINGIKGSSDVEKATSNLNVMREFWTLNREAILAGDYEKVVVPKNDYEKKNISHGQISKPAVDEEVTKKETGNIKYIEVTETDALEDRDEESFQWWLWLIGLLVVVSGLGLVFRSKS